MHSPQLDPTTYQADMARHYNRERILQQDQELAWSMGFGFPAPAPSDQAPWWRHLWRAITNLRPRLDGLSRPAALGRTGADGPEMALK